MPEIQSGRKWANWEKGLVMRWGEKGKEGGHVGHKSNIRL